VVGRGVAPAAGGTEQASGRVWGNRKERAIVGGVGELTRCDCARASALETGPGIGVEKTGPGLGA